MCDHDTVNLNPRSNHRGSPAAASSTLLDLQSQQIHVNLFILKLPFNSKLRRVAGSVDEVNRSMVQKLLNLHRSGQTPKNSLCAFRCKNRPLDSLTKMKDRRLARVQAQTFRALGHHQPEQIIHVVHSELLKGFTSTGPAAREFAALSTRKNPVQLLGNLLEPRGRINTGRTVSGLGNS